MDGFGIVGCVVEGILGLLTPGTGAEDGSFVLGKSRKRFPRAQRMLAREPSIDDGRPVVVIIAEARVAQQFCRARRRGRTTEAP